MEGTLFQYPLSGLDRLLPEGVQFTDLIQFCFNTLCRVLIGCYVIYFSAEMGEETSFNTLCRVLIGCYFLVKPPSTQCVEFQYPLSGLDRLLLLPARFFSKQAECFNTLCRVLIGCYTSGAQT